MQGFQLTFFTQQDRMQHGKSLAEWLLAQARSLGISGATLIAASEGFGHDHRLHSSHFFELSDQPLEITMAVSQDEADRMFAMLKQQGVDVFYMLTPIEYGMSSAR
jgi:PII-like signaling protein